jgi:ESCRT-II complex subunit VPS22
VEACLASRPHNGGLMSLRELHAAVSRRRGSAAAPVSEDDLLRAIAQLRVLGGGWDLLTVGGPTQRFVRSVPTELNGDQTALLGRAASAGGVLTAAGAAREAGWAPRRVSDALEALLKARRACACSASCAGERLSPLACVLTAPVLHACAVRAGGAGDGG